MFLIDSIPRPPLALPRPRVITEWQSTQDHDQWPAAPSGDGRPAILIPGFLAGDGSLRRMAQWLRTGGYVTRRSGVTWNVDCMEQTLTRLEVCLESLVEDTGRPALIIGQSRGGIMGRVLAHRRPDLVETLVTLGSPILNQLGVHPQRFAPIGAVGIAGTIGVPGFFGFGCISATGCCGKANADLVAPFPSDVRYLAMFSRTDEVVRWQSCVESAATGVEVECSHMGMGFDRELWMRLSAELARTPQAA